MKEKNIKREKIGVGRKESMGRTHTKERKKYVKKRFEERNEN